MPDPNPDETRRQAITEWAERASTREIVRQVMAARAVLAEEAPVLRVLTDRRDEYAALVAKAEAREAALAEPSFRPDDFARATCRVTALTCRLTLERGDILRVEQVGPGTFADGFGVWWSMAGFERVEECDEPDVG